MSCDSRTRSVRDACAARALLAVASLALRRNCLPPTLADASLDGRPGGATEGWCGVSKSPISDACSAAGTPSRSVLVTDRDRLAVRWCGEMYGVRRDVLRWALVVPGADPLSLGRVGTITRRWETLELVESGRLQHGRPDWLWLTSKGVAFAGLDFEPGEPQLVNLAHTHAVGVVRARAEHAAWCIGWVP